MDDALKDLPKAVYSLSPLDIIASHLYISNCFFFENALRQNGAALEQRLFEGLRRALRQYPILAGELRRSGLNALSIVVSPDKPNMPGWETVASDVTFRHLRETSFHYSQWPSELKVENPLLAVDARAPAKLICVRLCRFADNGGIAVLVRIAHAAFDAKGVVAFISHWALCCRELEHQTIASLPKPVALLSRDVMYRQLPVGLRPSPLPWLLYPLCLLLSLFLDILSFFLRKNLTFGDSDSHLFAISRGKMDAVRSEAKRLGASISDNDLIVALFTMAYAQSASAGLGSGKVKAIVPCDFRHRLDIPEAYVGNCAVGLFVTVPIQHLLKPISNESLVTVAMECRKTVDSADRNTIEQLVKRAMQSIGLLGSKARVLYSLMVCQAFSNQSRLDFYSVDFGLGPPLLAVPVAYPRTLAVVVPTPPSSDGTYIWLSLQSEQMKRLLQNKDFRSFINIVY